MVSLWHDEVLCATLMLFAVRRNATEKEHHLRTGYLYFYCRIEYTATAYNVVGVFVRVIYIVPLFVLDIDFG